MNGKENFSEMFNENEDEKTKKTSELKDIKLPFDMKLFWKNCNEKYFKPLNELDVNEINHLVHLYSKYGNIY